MLDGLNESVAHREEENRLRKRLRAVERRDQSLLILPVLVIIFLSIGLLMSENRIWDSHFSLSESAVDELVGLTILLILYIVFRHRQIRKNYQALTEERVRSAALNQRVKELRGILEVSSSLRSLDSLAYHRSAMRPASRTASASSS